MGGAALEAGTPGVSWSSVGGRPGWCLCSRLARLRREASLPSQGSQSRYTGGDACLHCWPRPPTWVTDPSLNFLGVEDGAESGFLGRVWRAHKVRVQLIPELLIKTKPAWECFKGMVFGMSSQLRTFYYFYFYLPSRLVMGLPSLL